MSKQVIFITNNTRLPQQIAKFFVKSSFKFTFVTEANVGVELAQHCSTSLVVIDHTIEISGIQISKSLRQLKIDKPILILLAQNCGYDLMSALNAGADYYMFKPLNLHLLRTQLLGAMQRTPQRQVDTIQVRDTVINKDKQQIERKSRHLYLKEREFHILTMLAENSGQVMNRERLHRATSFRPKVGDSSSIGVHISSLRKKLSMLGSKADIQTVYGQGYRLAD